MKTRSRNISLNFYINENEQKLLNEIIEKNHVTLSDYIRDKLFYENEDLNHLNDRYITPAKGKGEMMHITLSYKMLQLTRDILHKLGCSNDEVNNLDKIALDFAKEKREKLGYKIIKAEQDE